MEIAMTDLEELKHDLTVPKVLFNQRKSVHQALSKVLEMRNKWPERMAFEEFKRLAEQINGEAFDGRISKNGIRILIELTCPADVKQRAEYSKALRIARKAGCKPSELSEFFKSKGGIRKAAYG
jgi:hypothetical protein